MPAEIFYNAPPITPASHPVLYLSGPMTIIGPPDFNHAAFCEAASRLREQGFVVHNPAESFGGDKTRPYEDYMRLDLRLVTLSDAVALLPGWEASKGVGMELTVARFLDLPVVDAETLARIDAEEEWKRKTPLLPLYMICAKWRLKKMVSQTAASNAPQRVPVKRVAFAGFARSGKDEAGKALIDAGYTKAAFGDIIKRRVDMMDGADFAEIVAWVEKNEESGDDVLAEIARGFALVYNGDIDARTEDNARKKRIRTLLERYGEAFYDEILNEYLFNLPEKAVNTRLVRCKEAQAWRDAGGIILQVHRPGVGPASDWERDRLKELVNAGHIHQQIVNNGSVEDLHRAVREIVGIA